MNTDNIWTLLDTEQLLDMFSTVLVIHFSMWILVNNSLYIDHFFSADYVMCLKMAIEASQKRCQIIKSSEIPIHKNVMFYNSEIIKTVSTCDGGRIDYNQSHIWLLLGLRSINNSNERPMTYIKSDLWIYIPRQPHIFHNQSVAVLTWRVDCKVGSVVVLHDLYKVLWWPPCPEQHSVMDGICPRPLYWGIVSPIHRTLVPRYM